MRRNRWLVVVAAATLAAAPLASATHVDNMYFTVNAFWTCSDGSSFCQTDNAGLTWHDEASITITGHAYLNNVLETQFEPTDLSVGYTSTPSYSGSAETDVIFRQGTLPDGTLGQATCNDSVSDEKCDQQYVTFSVSTPTSTVICHEAGHGVGLTHGQQANPTRSNGDDSLGCMQYPDSQVLIAELGSHNVAMINATF